MEANFILSRSKVIEQYGKLKNLSTISYSWKTNPIVGKILEKETDSLFSVHSLEDFSDISDKNRVWFFAQAWSVKEIEDLMESGIKNFVVDNEVDLIELINCLNDINIKINLLLRMRFKERRVQSGKYFVYGMDSKTIHLWILKLRNNRSIGMLGVHVHRKSQNISEWDVKEELLDSLSKDDLKCISVINIGGGLPIKYRNYTSEVTEYIFSRIIELKKWLEEMGIELIIEPGRFIAGPSVKLEAEIISIYDNNIVINCSVYQGNTDAIFNDPLKLLVENESDSGKEYIIKGKTPCSLDIFRYKVRLANPKVGDKIVFLNAGAYNFGTDFCSLKRLRTNIVD